MDFLEPIKVKEYDGQPVTIAQVKFDGYYAEVYKSHSIPGQAYICTKSQKVNLWPKLQKIPLIKKQVESLPDNTILRCELHAPGLHATSVPTLVNEFDERLLLSPFCIELWDNDFLWINYRIERQKLVSLGFTVPKIYKDWKHDVSLSHVDIEELKHDAVRLGIEGFVLKDSLRNCWKIKPQKTVDAFVVDYTISDSDTYAGGLKSVDIAVWCPCIKKQVIIATVGTGFEGDYRMTINPKGLIGRVGEFKYQSIGAKGRLIFPRFLRWRDDEKSKSECLINQLKGI